MRCLLFVALVGAFVAPSYQAVKPTSSDSNRKIFAAVFAAKDENAECNAFSTGVIEWAPVNGNRCGSCSKPSSICMEEIARMFDSRPVYRCQRIPAGCLRYLMSGQGGGGGSRTTRRTTSRTQPTPRTPRGRTTRRRTQPPRRTRPPSNICALPRDSGTRCTNPRIRWSRAQYWDGTRCRPMLYRGCGGNANRFANTNECRAKCQSPGRPAATTKRPSGGSAVCRLKPNRGTSCGKRWVKRYAFYSNRGTCSLLWYRQCGGNGNNFKTTSECKTRCGGSV